MVTTQLELEEENLKIMVNKATQDYHKAKRDGLLSEFKGSTKIMPWYVGELANRIELYKASALAGKARVKPIPAKVMGMLNSETLAHLTIKTVVDSGGNVVLVQLARKLADVLSVEYKIAYINANSEKKDTLAKFVQSTAYRGNRKYKVTKDLISKYYKDIDKKLDTNMLKTALRLLSMATDIQPVINNKIAPPLFTISTIGKGKSDKSTIVKIMPWFKEWIMTNIENGSLTTAYHTALIEPPIPWEGLKGGGFHSERLKYNLINTRVSMDNYRGIDISNTINAVNRLQGTKWQVNTRVLEVMKYSIEKNLGLGGLPRNVTVNKTPYPFPDKKYKDLSDDEKAIVKEWRKAATAEYDYKVAEDSKYMSMRRAVTEADRFSSYPEIYFAYFLDFRGRIYPKASNLHPQGTKPIKALLRFAEGKEIADRDAEMFLAMQGANTYGNDKDTFINKHKWVLENEKAIIACASDPYDPNALWHTADDPWGFLAFCFEWADYRYYGKNFKSRIAIAMDGSCNGLQHLGAMFLDEVGGKSVNLTANAVKGDIYMDVANTTISLLTDEGSPLALKILEFGVKRKTVKRPVMIVPYAGTARACRDYIKEALVEQGAKEFFGEEFEEAVSFLSKYVWQAIGMIILKGREAMKFLGEVAKVIIKSTKSKDIRWTTPNGFLVIQRKTKNDYLRIATPLGDNINIKRKVYTKIDLPTDKTNMSKHKSSIAPNLVHSLDSCHLQNTVNSMSYGTSFAMIHDSYGTHAASSRELFNVLRQEFVAIYKNGDIMDKFILQQGIEIEGKPELGKLDINEVLRSEHFFS